LVEPAKACLPLAAMPDAARRGICYVLTDIDDTLSTHGKITGLTYQALERLTAAGKVVIPVTGRPAGWCDHIARMWPVDAIVGENGAFYMRYDRKTRKLVRRFALTEEERTARRVKLAAIGADIVREVQGARLASDQPYRESDLAIDYCEDVPPLASADVDRVVALMHAHGLTAKISSIHVNGWFGAYDKLAMTRTLLHEAHGVDLDQERERFVFAGDSPNDAPMFAFFPYAVGVANVRAFLDRIETPPAYVTRGEAGMGFAELADFLLVP
jgi:HAD superfamily hydrolase (TIGR01484 family)